MIFLLVDSQFSQHHSFKKKKWVLGHYVDAPLIINVCLLCNILFYSSVDLFVFIPVPCYFNYCSFALYIFMSQDVILPALYIYSSLAFYFFFLSYECYDFKVV